MDAISRGRAEIIAGRGLPRSFPLFGYDLADYDQLYAEKLDLLMRLNETTRITWNGKFRNPLKEALIVPRPHQDKLKIWLATGGNPESSVRAGTLGLPIKLCDYRRARIALRPSCQPLPPRLPEGRKGPVLDGGFHRQSRLIAEDAKAAKDTFFQHWCRVMASLAVERGFAAPTREHFDFESNKDGSLFAGQPRGNRGKDRGAPSPDGNNT